MRVGQRLRLKILLLAESTEDHGELDRLLDHSDSPGAARTGPRRAGPSTGPQRLTRDSTDWTTASWTVYWTMTHRAPVPRYWWSPSRRCVGHVSWPCALEGHVSDHSTGNDVTVSTSDSAPASQSEYTVRCFVGRSRVRPLYTSTSNSVTVYVTTAYYAVDSSARPRFLLIFEGTHNKWPELFGKRPHRCPSL